MKDYTNNAPVFSESIQITETSDPAHADIINKAPIQIFQNTLYNCKSIEKLERNAGNAEAHNTETEYQKGDYCTYDGSTYKCMQPTQGEWDSACWEKINLLSEISDLQTPEFDDSGTAAGITGFPAFLQKVKSKMNIFEFYRNFKAGMQYVLHTGQIVNNCTSEAENLALAAAQGKVLWDRQTQLISDLSLSLSTDILAYALSDSCKIGFSSGAFIGQNYTGELPDGDLKYGTWEINKRTNNTITVKAFTPYKSTMWINSYVNTAGWSGWKNCITNSDLAPTAMTTTRTENPYISTTAFNRIQARKIGPNLVLVKFNADIDLTQFPNGDEAVEIGKVNGISIVSPAVLVNIPAQNGSGTILLDFSDNGIFKILNWSGKPVSGFVRTSFVAVVNFA